MDEKERQESIDELTALFEIAVKFVDKHYVKWRTDLSLAEQRDRNIKIVATMNQLIELKKINQTKESIKLAHTGIEIANKMHKETIPPIPPSIQPSS